MKNRVIFVSVLLLLLLFNLISAAESLESQTQNEFQDLSKHFKGDFLVRGKNIDEEKIQINNGKVRFDLTKNAGEIEFQKDGEIRKYSGFDSNNDFNQYLEFDQNSGEVISGKFKVSEESSEDVFHKYNGANVNIPKGAVAEISTKDKTEVLIGKDTKYEIKRIPEFEKDSNALIRYNGNYNFKDNFNENREVNGEINFNKDGVFAPKNSLTLVDGVRFHNKEDNLKLGFNEDISKSNDDYFMFTKEGYSAKSNKNSFAVNFENLNENSNKFFKYLNENTNSQLMLFKGGSVNIKSQEYPIIDADVSNGNFAYGYGDKMVFSSQGKIYERVNELDLGEIKNKNSHPVDLVVRSDQKNILNGQLRFDANNRY